MQNPAKPFKFPRIILSPLSGISSLPFRRINREAGCKFAFLEMINARSLSYKSKRTLEMMRTEASDCPLGVQLLGKDLQYILKALENLKDYKYDILDFNAACPQKKVTSRGEGAALLKEPKELQKILKIIVKESDVPVTVKLRLGFDDAKNTLETAKHVRDAGVCAIFLHGRTSAQGYRSPVNYEAIKEVKANIDIPVIASGDIWSGKTAKKMFDETGCDSVMVARGALGNPWIFKEIEEFLSSGRIITKPKAKEVSQMMKRHFNMCIDFYGEKVGIWKFRKFFIWYTTGFSGVKQLRKAVFSAGAKQKLFKLIDEFSII
ncbi:MAG: tRNA dihydrouridine synthase DusB [Candidatus Omnitrophota bacterium]